MQSIRTCKTVCIHAQGNLSICNRDSRPSQSLHTTCRASRQRCRVSTHALDPASPMRRVLVVTGAGMAPALIGAHP